MKDRKWRSSFYKIMIVFFFILFGISRALFAEAKENSSISMKVSVNFNQYVRLNRNANLNILITSKKQDFTGYVQAIPQTDEPQMNSMYQTDISLKVKKQEMVNLTVPIYQGVKSIVLQVIDQDGNVLLKEKKKVKIETDSTTYYIGIIGKNENYLHNLDTKIFHSFTMEYDEIPERLEGFDSLEGILITNNFLREDSISALKLVKEWNRNGGTILLEKSSDALLHYMGVKRKDAKAIKDKQGLAMYNVFRNKKGVIIEWVYHKSMEVALSKNNEKLVDLLYDLKAHFSDCKVDHIDNNSYTSDTGENTLITSLETIEKKFLPKPVRYTMVLIAYACLVGPILYLILKRLKKNLHYYVGVLIASVVFIGIYILAGLNTTLDSFLMHNVAIYQYDDFSDTVDQEIFFSIVFPCKKSAKFSIKNKPNLSLVNTSTNTSASSSKILGQKAYDVIISKEKDKASVEIKNPLYMKPYVFKSTTQTKSERKICSNIVYDGEKVSGLVQNALGFDLEEAVLLSNYQMIPMGDFKNGTYFKIPEQYKNFGDGKIEGTIKTPYFRLSGPESNQDQSRLYEYQKSAAMQYCLREKCASYKNESYIIGFIHSDLKAKETNSEHSCKDIKMVVYRIRGVKKVFEGKQLITDIYPYEELHGGTINSTTRKMEGYYVIMDYYLPSEMKVDAILVNEKLNQQNNYSGSISIFNYKTEEYEYIYSNGNNGVVDKLRKKHYISGDNKFRLRYGLSVKEEYPEKNRLPVISAVVEVK